MEKMERRPTEKKKKKERKPMEKKKKKERRSTEKKEEGRRRRRKNRIEERTEKKKKERRETHEEEGRGIANLAQKLESESLDFLHLLQISIQSILVYFSRLGFGLIYFGLFRSTLAQLGSFGLL